MDVTRLSVTPGDDAVRAQAGQEFFQDAIFPQSHGLLWSLLPGPTPPMLVALVGPDEIDPGMRRVLDARAAEPDALRWSESIAGQVGWTTMASLSGDPVADAQSSYAKLNFDLTAPMRYKASFVFHLAQSSEAVRALSTGGFYAFALPELVRELSALSFADAMDSLPFFTVPGAPRLAELLAHLAGPAPD